MKTTPSKRTLLGRGTGRFTLIQGVVATATDLSVTLKREQASLERGTGKSHRCAMVANGDSHDFEV